MPVCILVTFRAISSATQHISRPKKCKKKSIQVVPGLEPGIRETFFAEHDPVFRISRANRYTIPISYVSTWFIYLNTYVEQWNVGFVGSVTFVWLGSYAAPLQSPPSLHSRIILGNYALEFVSFLQESRWWFSIWFQRGFPVVNSKLLGKLYHEEVL